MVVEDAPVGLFAPPNSLLFNAVYESNRKPFMTRSQRLNRREFLRTASAATLSALAAGYARPLLAEQPGEKLTATADTLIILWMGGGMAQTETFDPKEFVPFEKGIEPAHLASTFPSIDTVV